MVKDSACIGWVVDVQNDFMRPDGRLYVKDLENPDDPGATRVRERIAESVAWMERHCDLVVFTGDWHGHDDAEIDAQAPDPSKGTYPPHCMGRSDDKKERKGARIVKEIRPDEPEILEVDADEEAAERVARRAASTGHAVFIHKNRFDVFEGNTGTEAFLETLEEELGRPLRFVVVGVARDVCVTGAVDGLQARGYGVTALRDATWGLGLEPEEKTLARWASKGRVTTLEELRNEG